MRPWHASLLFAFVFFFHASSASAETLLLECKAKTAEGGTGGTATASQTCTVPAGVTRFVLDYALDDGGDITINGANYLSLPNTVGIKQGTKDLSLSVSAGDQITVQVTAKNATQGGGYVATVYGRASLLVYGNVAPSVLTGTCTPGANPSVWLSWTPVDGATTNAIQKGDYYPEDERYWEFVFGDTPPYDTYTYFDDDLLPNTVYKYRVKTDAQVSSNEFVCDTTPPAQVYPPDATTDEPTNVAQNSATLRGSVNPRGFETQFWFEYGRSQSLGSKTPTKGAGGGSNSVSQESNLSGLSSDTDYFYRIVAQSYIGTTRGSVKSFRTSSSGTPPPSTPPPSAPNAPRANLKVNGSDGPLTVTVNSAVSLSWNSMNASTCSVGPGGYSGVSGTQDDVKVASRTTFTLTCTGPGGTASDKVSVDVKAAPVPVRAPSVSTLGPSDFGYGFATVNGYVNPNGGTTQTWFEYGPSQNLNRTTQAKNVGSGRSAISFTADLAIEEGQEYFYRIVARNSQGVSRGETRRLISGGGAFFTIEPAFQNLELDGKVQFRAWYDADGSGPKVKKEVTSDTVWISDNTLVAYHDKNAVFLGQGYGKTEVRGIYSPDGPVRNVNDIGNLRAESVIVIDEGERPSADVTLGLAGTTSEQAPEEKNSNLLRNALWGFLAVLVIAAALLGFGWLRRRLKERAD